MPFSSVGAFAFNAQDAQNSNNLGGVAANQYVQTSDSRLSDARTPTAGNSNYIQNQTGTVQSGGFNVSGSGIVGGNFSANNATVNGLTVNGAATITGSITGNGGNISGLNAVNITLGSLSDTRLSSNIPRLNAANLFTNNVSVQGDFTVGGTITGNGSGLTSLNVASVTTGTFSDTRLSSNIPRLNVANTFSGTQSAGIFNAALQFNLGGNPFLSAPGATNLFAGFGAGGTSNTGASNSFIGTSAGAANTSGAGNVFVGRNAGLMNNTGGSNTFIGTGAGNTNTTGSNNTVIGAGATINATNFVTVIGAGATGLGFDNTVTIGRSVDTTYIPGSLLVDGIQSGGGQSQLCYSQIYRVTACSSSIRYKKDVENFTSGLDLVRRLRPVTFTWKSNDQRDLGFVAEEVNAVEPLMTTYNEKGEVEGVKYDRISAALVNAVNEQQTEITQQKETIERQNEQLQKQQQQIDALRELICSANPQVICRPKK